MDRKYFNWALGLILAIGMQSLAYAEGDWRFEIGPRASLLVLSTTLWISPWWTGCRETRPRLTRRPPWVHR
jgi:hypothetical protein